MSQIRLKRYVEYFVACVSEFAQAYGLTHPDAFDYLERYRGFEFLEQHYEAEHLLSFRDAVNDLAAICRKNGGRL
ncbi:MAG: DUF3791 domain-containing protein [Kiritimatiellae bacterium]|nr:DUF3791 domain-containing protein [Kiritimatiellia bacterium]